MQQSRLVPGPLFAAWKAGACLLSLLLTGKQVTDPGLRLDSCQRQGAQEEDRGSERHNSQMNAAREWGRRPTLSERSPGPGRRAWHLAPDPEDSGQEARDQDGLAHDTVHVHIVSGRIVAIDIHAHLAPGIDLMAVVPEGSAAEEVHPSARFRIGAEDNNGMASIDGLVRVQPDLRDDGIHGDAGLPELLDLPVVPPAHHRPALSPAKPHRAPTPL